MAWVGRRAWTGRRGGFAIVMVVLFAALVFLIGSVLVVMSQLRATASQYDQRQRLARDNARAALEIALSELQAKLGPDRRVSFTADGFRKPADADLKGALDAAAYAEGESSLAHPFWTGVEGGGSNRSWLVSQPMSGTAADPFSDSGYDWVELLGPGTVEEGLEVTAPKLPFTVRRALGFEDAAEGESGRTIGHYAFWVGDLGVKGSLAWRDTAEEVTHGYYADGLDVDGETPLASEAKLRLRDLRLNFPRSGLFPMYPQEVDESPPESALSNAERVDRYLSDFQFRSGYDGDTEGHRFFHGLTAFEYRSAFHDFTPLSRGLLVDAEAGGWREDVSPRLGAGIEGMDTELLAYARFAAQEAPLALDSESGALGLRSAADSGPLIAPVVTEFNLVCGFDYAETEPETGQITASVSIGVELWNPFSAPMDCSDLALVAAGVPEVAVRLGVDGLGTPVWILNPNDESASTPEFALSEANALLQPGEVATFSLLTPLETDAAGRYVLERGLAGYQSEGAWAPWAVSAEFPVPAATGVAGLSARFEDIDGVALVAPIRLVARMAVDDAALATFRVASDFHLDSGVSVAFDGSEPTPALRFGFSWEMGDQELPGFVLSSGEITLDVDKVEYNAGAAENLSASFAEAEADGLLLGEAATIADREKLALIWQELPQQELLSTGQLGASVASLADAEPFGEPGSPRNALFDQFFFSGIPASAGERAEADALPLGQYRPAAGESLDSLANAAVAEGLFVDGMFNVNSTSIDAWVGLLKGSSTRELERWGAVFAGEERFLFFNRPHTAFETYLSQAPWGEGAPSASEARRASMRHGAIALSAQEVETLAKMIVKHARLRFQGAEGYGTENDGPFLSLRDFLDSGVLANAIAEANVALGGALNPSWVVRHDGVDESTWQPQGSWREFRQLTLLSAIGPYLSARSDTFLVRAYGDAVDPADGSTVWARAYCEAVVQRTHRLVEGSTEASNPERVFEVVAFRWLSREEI